MNYPTANIIPVNTDTNVVQIEENRLVEVDNIGNFLCERNNGKSNLSNKSFWLDPMYEWIIVTDSTGETVLVPMKKD